VATLAVELLGCEDNPRERKAVGKPSCLWKNRERRRKGNSLGVGACALTWGEISFKGRGRRRELG